MEFGPATIAIFAVLSLAVWSIDEDGWWMGMQIKDVDEYYVLKENQSIASLSYPILAMRILR
jgi:hypothetical protein